MTVGKGEPITLPEQSSDFAVLRILQQYASGGLRAVLSLGHDQHLVFRRHTAANQVGIGINKIDLAVGGLQCDQVAGDSLKFRRILLGDGDYQLPLYLGEKTDAQLIAT